MMQRSKTALLVFFLFLSFTSIGQNDSLNRLSINNFLGLVKQNHPMVKQANLIVKSAEANTLLARGAFDPKLFYEFRNKFFDDKSYYALSDGGFSIPTWFGIEMKGGLEQNQGQFLNPENTSPNQGLFYSQLSFSVLQGLIIDQRRATLKQAKIFRDLSEFEKINTINEILYKAGLTYLEWYLSYNNLAVYENAVSLSQTRFNAVKQTFVLGDRPAIDTVEANIQLQDRIINYQQALVEYRTKSLLLSNYLWNENEVPVEITNQTIPLETVNGETIFNLNVSAMDSLISLHPSLKIYDFKLKQLSVEEKFKRDKLKPNLNVIYNPLFSNENLNAGYLNNYKLGVTFAFPILLRKERGDLQLTKVKIAGTIYENKNKRIELLNKTKATINEYANFKNQSNIYRKNVSNYEQLWLSERRLFDAGESSLFMINSREMSYINAQIKLNEIIMKSKKAALDTEFSFGRLSFTY